jgi:hypothetical protein
MPLPLKHRPQSEIQKLICIVDDDEGVADSLQALLRNLWVQRAVLQFRERVLG